MSTVEATQRDTVVEDTNKVDTIKAVQDKEVMIKVVDMDKAVEVTKKAISDKDIMEGS